MSLEYNFLNLTQNKHNFIFKYEWQSATAHDKKANDSIDATIYKSYCLVVEKINIFYFNQAGRDKIRTKVKMRFVAAQYVQEIPKKYYVIVDNTKNVLMILMIFSGKITITKTIYYSQTVRPIDLKFELNIP